MYRELNSTNEFQAFSKNKIKKTTNNNQQIECTVLWKNIEMFA